MEHYVKGKSLNSIKLIALDVECTRNHVVGSSKSKILKKIAHSLESFYLGQNFFFFNEGLLKKKKQPHILGMGITAHTLFSYDTIISCK